jgi:hypothetical protein
MSPTSNRDVRSTILAILAFAIGLTAIAIAIAAHDDALQRNALYFLKPLVDGLIPKIAPLERNSTTIIRYIQEALLWLSGAALLSGAIWRRTVSSSNLCLTLAGIAAIYGQLAIAQHNNLHGAIAYGAAGLLLILFLVTPKRELPFESEPTQPLTWPESLVFLSIFVLALILRFYALNRILHFFEGELSPFAAAANDLRGMSRANIGLRGPWSPFGYNFYLLVYATTHLVGTNVLALRLSTAVPAIAMIFLSYFFLRNIFSRAVAIAGVLVLTIDAKHISWSRFEFPHHGPALPAMLICWLTYLSFESRRTIYPLLLILVMGYSFHQYPSGQTSFLIPWVYLGYLLVFNRRYSWKIFASRALVFILGTLCWHYGHSIALYFVYDQWLPPDYLGRFDGRVSWKRLAGTQSLLSSIVQMGTMYWSNFLDLFGSMVVQLRHAHPPQELTPGFGNLTQRTIFILVPPMALVATCAFLRHTKWKGGALLLSWILAGSLPAILSDGGYSRRAASIFPALMFLAATGYAIMRHAIVGSRGLLIRLVLGSAELAVGLCLILATFHQIFSGGTLPYREPHEEVVMRRISPLITPGSIVFIDSEDHYVNGKFTYLMLDYLNDPKNKPVAWANVDHRHQYQIQSLVEDPRRVISLLRDSIFYDWTSLWYHLPEIEAYRNWQTLVYILVRFPSTPLDSQSHQRFELMKQTCATPPDQVTEIRLPEMYNQVLVYSCRLRPSPLP